MTRYADYHRRSIEDRDAFWAEQAKLVDWKVEPKQICDYSNPPFAKWFIGGQTNLCHNALDRHAAAHPDRQALRQKFLAEHTHSEDEVRFFVEGRGLFCLHLGEEVLQVLCEAGDWIAVPAGTRHWFDMGPEPHFCALRFFDNPAGWVAEFTGDQIADHYPRLDDLGA